MMIIVQAVESNSSHSGLFQPIRWCLRFFVAIAIAWILAGCGATKYKVDPELIKSFKEPVVAANKTGVYVIRGSNFIGSGRGLWVAANNAVVASLPNASHVYLELDAKTNTLHFVQATAGFGYLPIDNRPGEVVYAQFGYATTGKTIELEQGLGKSTVMRTKKVEPLEEPRPNDAYDNLLINPGLLNYPIMVNSSEKREADERHALLTFYRPTELIADLAFDVWNQDGYVGSTTGKTYFSVKVPAGKHRFISRSERYAILDAELVADRQYAVELHIGMGWNQAHIKLLPIDLNDISQARKVEQWKQTLTVKAVDQNVLNGEAVAPRIKQALRFLEKETQNLVDTAAASRVLPVEFGIK